MVDYVIGEFSFDVQVTEGGVLSISRRQVILDFSKIQDQCPINEGSNELPVIFG